MDQRAFSNACDRNHRPIGEQLSRLIEPGDLVWEIGSGTGQHAVLFGARFPDATWQPSDRAEHHASIEAWRAHAALPNVSAVLPFDLFDELTPVSSAQLVFCANTIHIAPWAATAHLFRHAAAALSERGALVTYGPYRYADRPLEPSNETFDAWLKSVDPNRGIRLFEDVVAAAAAHGFAEPQDVAMPANNRLLIFRRRDILY